MAALTSMRVTEGANPLTAWLDVADPESFVRMLAACDTGLFVGFAGLPNVYSDEVVAQCVKTVRGAAAVLAHPRGRIVFSGCGTSGRVAHLLAYELNTWWDRISAATPAQAEGSGAAAASTSTASRMVRFHYLLAGGDKALLVPQEAVEDQHDAGEHDLLAWCTREGVTDTAAPVLLIGISCGLSATYVASMLHASLAMPNFFSVAMGFNPVDAVSSVIIPGCPVTFHSLLRRMLGHVSEAADAADAAAAVAARCAVINPVVGPEAVAGSSRMKGGSITWVLCAAVCQAAVQHTNNSSAAAAASDAALASELRNSFLQFEVAVRELYGSCTTAVAALVADATSSLTARGPDCGPLPTDLPALQAAATAAAAAGRRYVSPTGSGRLLYLGAGAAGLFGLIDASEATDTYGSLFGDVRGFAAGGWQCMGVQPDATDPEVPLELRGFPVLSPDADAAAVAARAAVPPEHACPSVHSFCSDIVPTLTPHDLVVIAHIAGSGAVGTVTAACHRDELLRAAAAATAAGAKVRHLLVTHTAASGAGAGADDDAVEAAFVRDIQAATNDGVVIQLSRTQLSPATTATAAVASRSPPSLAVLALKLAMNAISTGAHVGKGVVVGNRMVNMMLTNHKLYLRAINIVAEVAGVAPGTARTAILRAAYNADAPAYIAQLVASDDSDPAVVNAHIARASTQEKVIPTALLLALALAGYASGSSSSGTKPLNVAAARKLLAEQPAVRKAFQALKDGSY